MKTPKRKYAFPIDSLNYPGMRTAFEAEEVPSAHAMQCTRWKNKNRIKQLKSTIQKYKDGTMLPKFTPLRRAYKWLQELKRPKSDAPVSSWVSYLSELKSIRSMINMACEDAAKKFGQALEREERKEQK